MALDTFLEICQRPLCPGICDARCGHLTLEVAPPAGCAFFDPEKTFQLSESIVVVSNSGKSCSRSPSALEGIYTLVSCATRQEPGRLSGPLCNPRHPKIAQRGGAAQPCLQIFSGF